MSRQKRKEHCCAIIYLLQAAADTARDRQWCPEPDKKRGPEFSVQDSDDVC